MTSNGESSLQNGKRVEEDADFVKEEYFHDILEKQFGKCSIKEFNLQKNSGGGENYMSVMFRVSIKIEKIDGTIDTAYYIVKMMSPNDTQAAFKKKLRAFEREVEMLSEIIPKFEQTFREHGVEVKFAPKLYKYLTYPEIMIMEDLKVGDFKNINRLEGMNLQHAKVALTKLAQFHAVSACIFEKSGRYSEQLMHDTITKEMESDFAVMQAMIWDNFCKNMRSWDTCQEYVPKMEKLKYRIADIYMKALKKDLDEFNVLVHGDFWANNMMFHHNSEGAAEEVIFVDLQVSRYASPIQDLIYFIFSSTEYSIKVKEFDYMIKFYHDELLKNLKLLKYPKVAPTLVDLHITAVKRSFLGIIVCTGVMAAALLAPNENANIEVYLSDSDAGEKFKRDFYTNPKLIKSCEIIFQFLDNKGVFEV